MRTIRKILVIAVLLLAVLITVSLVLARVFEDELTQYVVNELNGHIRTEARVENVHLSFIRKFPDASLEFRDVFLASTPDFQESVFDGRNTDTLLVADQLFLRFNMLKLFRKEYLIREVQVRSGKLNVFIDRAGNGNYTFWEKKNSSGEKDFLLELENVNLENIDVHFDNRALEQEVQGKLRKCYFRGSISALEFNMSAGLDGEIISFRSRGLTYLSGQKISASSSLSINPLSISITEGKVVLAGQHISVSGQMFRPSPFDLDLNFEGKDLAVETVLKILAMFNKKVPGQVKAGGNLGFSGQIRGVLSNTHMPWINAEFSLEGAWIETPELPDRLYDIRTKGKYTNGKRQAPETSSLQLSDVSLRYRNSRIGGEYSMVNFISPDFNYFIQSELDLSDFKEFIKSGSTVESIGGKLVSEVRISGAQSLLKDLKKKDFLKYRYNARFRLDNVSASFEGLSLGFEGISGEADFTDHLQLHNMSGVFGGSNISMKGRVDNLLEYILTPEGNLWMDLDLYSDLLDLNLLKSLNAAPESQQKTDSVYLPGRLYLKSRFWFDGISINDFQATQITGNLIYNPRRLSINHIELHSMDGRVLAEGLLEQQADMHFLVKCISEVHSVDITRAFRSFNNFGQDFIQDKHLNGTIDGKVNFSAGLDQKMRIKNESILADCDVVISNGELRGFEPMLSLSRFIDVKELEDIRFSTLKNEIFIRNSEVMIPKMNISSSAADITASGVHGFDGNYSYKVKVALSELRSKRSKKLQQYETEFGPIGDDGLGKVYVYLIIEGTPDETEVRYDRRGAVQNIRDQMKDEKTELKKILNEEFGLFKKDTGLRSHEGAAGRNDMIIEWDEAREDTAGSASVKDNKKEDQRFIIVWDEDEPGKDTLVEPGGKRIRRKKK